MARSSPRFGSRESVPHRSFGSTRPPRETDHKRRMGLRPFRQGEVRLITAPTLASLARAPTLRGFQPTSEPGSKWVSWFGYLHHRAGFT